MRRGALEVEAELAAALVPAQRWDARGVLPRRRLGVAVRVLLIALRVYVLVALPLVAYVFVRALHAPR